MNSIRFRIAAAMLVFGALALTLTHPAAAFIRIARQADATSPVVQAHWFDSELPLNSVIDPTNADISSTDALATVIQSAKNWENVNTSYFTVNPHQFSATDSIPKLAFDGQNSMFFDNAGANFTAGSGVIAFVRSIVDLSDGHTLDADLVFNDKEFFASISTPNLTPAPPTPPGGVAQSSVDLQAVLTHEYGHYFGLDHTSVAGATMVPFISNDISQRTLELDDRAGISTIFPESAARGLSADGVDFLATTGTISGTVLSGYNGSAVFGAHVEAINLSDFSDISAISGELTLRNGQGEYTIHGLPPGNYAVAIVPLDGVHTIAADANIGGPYNGLDINFPVEFWNGANETGNGFNDNANDFVPVPVTAAANTPGVNFITNTFPGQVVIAPHGEFENIVTFTSNAYLAVRFDPPFEGPYTISNITFPSFTFNGVPALFPLVGLYPMNPATGGPDLPNPLFTQVAYAGNPGGNNVVPLNIPVNTPNKTFFWVIRFPNQASVPAFPNNFPFIRVDINTLEKGLYAASYSVNLAGAASISVDRNYAVDMTCQLANPGDVPIVAPTGLGANRRATQTEFSFVPSADKRADGFDMPHNSLLETHLIERTLSVPTYADIDTAGAGADAMHLSPSPPSNVIGIVAAQSLDKNGHRSLQSPVTILGLNEDADEPNGRLNEAKVLPGNVTNRAETYSPAGDQDFFSVMAKPGDIIDASATATAQDGRNNTDLVMFLYDSNGDVVAFNDDFTGLNPRIVFTAPPNPGNSKNARKFTIQVTDFRSSTLTNPVPQVRVPQTYVLSASVTTPPAAAAQFAGRVIDPDHYFFANSGPNPANPVAKFLFVIPRNAGNAAVRLNIYDVRGRMVRTLVDGKVMEAGPHTTLWDGRDTAGNGVASGTYFARMEAGSWHQDTRVTILK